MSERAKIKSLPGEKWKGLPGYEDYYEISNMGRVKSLAKTWIAGKGGIHKKLDTLIKGSYHVRGYHQFMARLDGTRKGISVHGAVYDLFGEGKRNKGYLVVCHKNGIVTDNRIDNLYLETRRRSQHKNMKAKKYSSKYLGVGWRIHSKKWISNIRINGKLTYLGSFDDELEASNAYQKKLAEIQAQNKGDSNVLS